MTQEFLYNDITVLLILASITFAAIWLDAHVNFFKKIGAAALTILFGMALSNTGVLPPESNVYQFFSGDGILAGIILILLKINLSTLKKAGVPMMKAFFIGAFGSALGALVMGYWLFPQLGLEAWKLSGQFAATYIGGGMNYAAMGAELGTESTLFSAGIAADVIITAIWLIVCITIPGLLENFREKSGKSGVQATEEDLPDSESQNGRLDQLLFKSARPIGLGDIAVLVMIVVGTIWASKFLAGILPFIPMIIWLTTIVLILAQFSVIKELAGSMVLGNYLIMLFLATNGARSLISRIIEIGPAIFYFALGTVVIHGVIIFGIGRLMKIKSSILAVASQANIGGSASAMAIAGARGHTTLILSGVAVGMLGNAVGNYIGMLIAFLTKWLII